MGGHAIRLVCYTVTGRHFAPGYLPDIFQGTTNHFLQHLGRHFYTSLATGSLSLGESSSSANGTVGLQTEEGLEAKLVETYKLLRK